jgi:signal transduction histidine kinase/BarA-like signal transduction histidine kinase
MNSNFQNDLMPHGFCIRWSWDLITIYVLSNGLLFLAYMYIGISLMAFARLHNKVSWNPLLWLFSAFIVTCGITHIMEIVTFWQPYYWMDAALKSLTALVSIATVVYIAPRFNMLLHLHTNEDLELINQKLNIEITERKKSHQLLLKLSESINGIVFQFQMFDDGSYVFNYISNSIKDIFDLSPQDVYDDAKNIFKYMHPDDTKQFSDSMKNSSQSMKVWSYECRLVFPEKDTLYLFFQSAPEKIIDGSFIWYGTITNITATKNISRIHHSQKLESIGRLTAGISHDFNNLLTAISGYNEFNKCSAEEFVSVNSDSEDFSKEIISNSIQVEKACSKAANLIEKMLLYCRRNNEESIHNPIMNLNEKLNENLIMLRSMIPSSIIFKSDLDAHILELPELDESNFNQIIMNLYLNASGAIKSKGIIISHTGIIHLDNICNCCQENFYGKFIEISVSDNGSGIDPVVAQRIFEPFFTTKGIGSGTGLGLSVISGIVHNAGGHILLESELGVGTTFKLLFPFEPTIQYRDKQTLAPSKTPHERLAELADSLKNIRVLIVEDNLLNQQVARDFLINAKLHVTVANNGKEALNLLENNSFDIILMDIQMPIMGGIEATKIIRENPKLCKLPIIAMSSGVTFEAQEVYFQNGINDFIAKPINPLQLLSKVKNNLHIID